MAKSRKEGWTRLAIGAALNSCLWPLWHGFSRWISHDREFRFALIGGVLAAATFVAVVPTFWRGQGWQVPLAFLLLWLPSAVVFGVVQLIINRS
jgi:hypothetical protein